MDRYDKVCPPNGENKGVVYTIMLQGVWKTFKACNAVRATIEATEVVISERDVLMGRGFREELRDLMKKKGREAVIPPQFFCENEIYWWSRRGLVIGAI